MILVYCDDVVLLDLLEVAIVLDLDVCGNSIEVTFFSQLIDPLPICLVVTSYGSYSERPWAVYSCILLHAVIICSVVDTYCFDMKAFVMFLDVRCTHWLWKVLEEL